MKWVMLGVVMSVMGCGSILDPGFLGSWNMNVTVTFPQHDPLTYQSILTISPVPQTGSYIGTGICPSQNDRFILEGNETGAHAVVTWNGTMTCFPLDLIWCHRVTLDYQALNFIFQQSTNEITGTGTGQALDLDCQYIEPITLSYRATVVQ